MIACVCGLPPWGVTRALGSGPQHDDCAVQFFIYSPEWLDLSTRNESHPLLFVRILRVLMILSRENLPPSFHLGYSNDDSNDNESGGGWVTVDFGSQWVEVPCTWLHTHSISPSFLILPSPSHLVTNFDYIFLRHFSPPTLPIFSSPGV